MAKAVERAHVVGNEHDRTTFIAHVVEDVETLLLEGGIADREHLIDEQDLRVHLDGNRKGQTHMHSRGVVLQL